MAKRPDPTVSLANLRRAVVILESANIPAGPGGFYYLRIAPNAQIPIAIRNHPVVHPYGRRIPKT